MQRAFDRWSLGELRRVVRACAAGIDRERALDLVQLRVLDGGSVVRVHLRVGA